jgi:putative DNA primase/helicase
MPGAPIDAGLLPPEDRWKAKLIYTRDGMKDCRENLIYILSEHPEWKGALAYDIFAKRVIVRRASPIGHPPNTVWTPEDDVRLGMWMAERQRLVVRAEDTLARSVGYVAKLTTFHPVREFLEGVMWDKKPRLDTWAALYLGASPTQYTSRVGRYFLLNLVRRAFEPGCVMRSVPVLEGPQNIGKSTLARLLAQPWFSDSAFNLENKDVFQLIGGVWLYEVSELDSFNKNDVTRVKAFVSSRIDRYRAPYDRAPQDQPRETCFIATTNANEYLRDWTGNTRFWPISCGTIDLEGFATVRDQLLAEAVALYGAGGDPARSHPSRQEEIELFQPEQDARLAIHPWFYVISDWLTENGQIESVSTNEILKGAIHMSAIDMGKTPGAAQVVGNAMKRLAWDRRRETKGDRQWRYYRPAKPAPPPVNRDEVPF